MPKPRGRPCARASSCVGSACFGFALAGGAYEGFDAGGAQQFPVDARHALHLALGREALVEAFSPELAFLLAPGCEALGPAFQAAVLRGGVLRREVSTHADQRL